MKSIRVGVIGAGGMGSTHARRWSEQDGAVVAGIADLDREKATALAAVYGACAYASAEELLAAGGLDAVSVCVPTHLHRAITETALAAGCHVLCEKPMALSVADCDAMIAAAQRAGRLLSVAQVVRFFPEYANAKREVDAGAVGAPAVVRCRRGGGFPAWSAWFADEAQSGGILFDLAVHEIDWLLWCFGPVERVYAKSLTQRLAAGDFDHPLDYGLLTLRHASGVVSHVETTWADPLGGATIFEIAGDAGLLEHNARRTPPLTFRSTVRSGSANALIQSDDPYWRQIAAFAQAVRGEAPLAVTAEEGRAAIAVAAAAAESARGGRVVTVR